MPPRAPRPGTFRLAFRAAAALVAVATVFALPALLVLSGLAAASAWMRERPRDDSQTPKLRRPRPVYG